MIKRIPKNNIELPSPNKSYPINFPLDKNPAFCYTPPMEELRCTGCFNLLYQNGSVIDSDIGPLVVCDICRALYYLQVTPATEECVPIAVIVPTNFSPEDEYDVIRSAITRVSLSDYLLSQIPPCTEEEQEKEEEERIINPHFEDEDEEEEVPLKDIIESSVTPTDFLEKLKFYE